VLGLAVKRLNGKARMLEVDVIAAAACPRVGVEAKRPHEGNALLPIKVKNHNATYRTSDERNPFPCLPCEPFFDLFLRWTLCLQELPRRFRFTVDKLGMPGVFKRLVGPFIPIPTAVDWEDAPAPFEVRQGRSQQGGTAEEPVGTLLTGKAEYRELPH
jgi:hypothetical protein